MGLLSRLAAARLPWLSDEFWLPEEEYWVPPTLPWDLCLIFYILVFLDWFENLLLGVVYAG